MDPPVFPGSPWCLFRGGFTALITQLEHLWVATCTFGLGGLHHFPPSCRNLHITECCCLLFFSMKSFCLVGNLAAASSTHWPRESPRLTPSSLTDRWWEHETHSIFRWKLTSQPWIFIGRTDAEAPILWPPDARLIGKDPEAGKGWRQKDKGMAEDEVVRYHHCLDGHEFEQTPGDSEGQEACHAAVHGVAKSQTRLSDWATTTGVLALQSQLLSTLSFGSSLYKYFLAFVWPTNPSWVPGLWTSTESFKCKELIFGHFAWAQRSARCFMAF